MEWTLAILFGIAIVLFVLSGLKKFNSSKEEKREIDMIHLSVTDEIMQLQTQMRNMELDLEIVKQEANLKLSSEELVLLREILDLYNRKYSVESIAAQKKVSENEIKRLLTPYMKAKGERRKVANER